MQSQNFYTAEDYFYSFKRGEEQGFNYFFHLYYKPLVHFAFTIVNSKEAAEDIVEDSFVKLWEKRETIESAAGIKPYLYTTVRNSCINLFHREGYHNGYLNSITNEIGKKFEHDVSHKIIMAEAMSQVYSTLETLPPQSSEIIRMYYMEGRNLNEIADELHLTLPAVKSRKAKALKLLQQQLPHLKYLSLLLIFL